MFVSNSGEKVQETKISYLNINGLLDNKHIVDLSHDINLLSSDFLCLAETKIDENVSNDDIQIPSFEIVARLDSLLNCQS